MLNDVIIKCKIYGEVLIIGDCNCHFGHALGSRFYGGTTRKQK